MSFPALIRMARVLCAALVAAANALLPNASTAAESAAAPGSAPWAVYAIRLAFDDARTDGPKHDARSTNQTAEQTFSSVDEAVAALTAAAKAKDTNAFQSIFGPAGQELVSADAVQATEAYETFLRRLNEKVQQAQEGRSGVMLRLGSDGWPFPIPLVKQNERWFFDTQAGRDEILNRRVGMNELSTIRFCQSYVEAQREYASRDRNGDGVLEYAEHLRSSPGKRDGLYWPVQSGEDLSPLGPLVAAARGEGYRREKKILTEEQSSPYHGYYFKILTRQGKHAAGEKYDYIINGHMIGGFALVAWPAEWGNTGVMTFIVNQSGKVYQKNLGRETPDLAEKMTTFDPDDSWDPARD